MATDPKPEQQNQQNTPEEATGWRPDTGSVLKGTVTEVSKGWSDYADAYYPIVTIREDGTDKLVAVHCFHEILKQRMMDARPTIGSELEITCLGEKPTRDGKRTYVAYTVTVPGEDGSAVWDQLGAQPSAAAQAGQSAQDEFGF